jgi:AcrR family transcriptional regulator
MPRPATDKRERLAVAALNLTYTRGFERASIAEIAAEAGVASGSVYYYFKTKDDVGVAILEQLAAQYRDLLAQWGEVPEPSDRLVAFVDSYVADKKRIATSGGVLGTVTREVAQSSPPLGAAAAAIYQEVIDWAAAQFEALGFDASASAARALHLVTVMEGAAAMSAALGSPEPIDREAAHLTRWIERTG